MISPYGCLRRFNPAEWPEQVVWKHWPKLTNKADAPQKREKLLKTSSPGRVLPPISYYSLLVTHISRRITWELSAISHMPGIWTRRARPFNSFSG